MAIKVKTTIKDGSGQKSLNSNAKTFPVEKVFV
jgi:hypothetical protein